MRAHGLWMRVAWPRSSPGQMGLLAVGWWEVEREGGGAGVGGGRKEEREGVRQVEPV